jgi:hypothetical protein
MELIELLRASAFYIKIDPLLSGNGKAVSVSELLEVFKGIQDSFEAYLDAQFRRSFDAKKVSIDEYDKKFKAIKAELSLLIVDLNYASVGTAISANTITGNMEFPDVNVLQWKKTSFNEFKDEVIYADYNSPEFLDKIESKYQAFERKTIYDPIIRILKRGGSKYHLCRSEGGFLNPNPIKLKLPRSLEVLSPETNTIAKKKETSKFVNLIVRTPEDSDLFSIGKQQIQKIYHAVEIDEDVIPFETSHIEYNGISVHLKKEIICLFEKEDSQYILTFEPLKIMVWGDSREEAIEAFCFSFIDLYTNFLDEDDENLTEDGKEFKSTMERLILE